MVDSINSTSGVTSAQRASQVASLRPNATIVDAVATREQRTSSAAAPVNNNAVTQAAKKSNSSAARQLPRGSLVDVLT